MSLIAASEVATTFAAVGAAVFAFVGACIKVAEKNLGAAAAYVAVSLIAVGIALQNALK